MWGGCLEAVGSLTGGDGDAVWRVGEGCLVGKGMLSGGSGGHLGGGGYVETA